MFKDIHIGDNIPNSFIDGKDIINLFEPETELGKLLNPFKVTEGTEFLKWKFYSIKNLLDFLRLEDYKEEWLNIKNQNNTLKKEIRKLKTKRINSYWGIVTIFILKKIEEEPKIKELLLENNLPFNMYTKEEQTIPVLGGKYAVKKKLNSFNGYCKVITFVNEIIKNNYTEEEARNLIKNGFPNIEEDINKILG